jgi:hypothetical protein
MIVCDVCGGNQNVRAPLIGWRGFGLPEHICVDCLMAWYDLGMTDPVAIREHVLARRAAGAK